MRCGSRNAAAKRSGVLAIAALAACFCVRPAASTLAAGTSAHQHGHNHPERGQTSRELRSGHLSRPANRPHAKKATNPLASSDLWATVDICKASGPPTIGIRGSMPSDGHSNHTMYMRFKLQYRDTSKGKWVDLQNGAIPSSYVKIGAANTTRQGGRSFQLAPSVAEGKFELRGLVYFQWRDQSKVVLEALRPTTSRHRDAVGAAPKGFSAASCVVN